MNVCLDDPKVNEVYTRIKKVITSVLKVAEEKIQMESKYIDDFGADSLDRVTLVMQLEDEFGRDISDEEAQKLTTVGATVEFVLDQKSI